MSPPLKPPPKNVPGFPKRNLPHAVSEEVVTKPERKTALPPPDVPPEPSPNVPREKPPSMFARAKAGFGSSWTPATIAAAVVVIITALGGQAGLSTLLGASEETRKEIRESEARIMARFDEKAAAERAAHDAINARISVMEARDGQQTELLCQLNDGRPNETWPCGEQRFDPPPKGNLAPKWMTARKYP